MIRRISLPILLSAALALLAACSPAATAPVEPVEVPISLTEFAIDSAQSTFKVGQPYRFVITNDGGLNHEFMIMEPAMPGMEVEHAHGEGELAAIEEDDLPPGASVTLDVVFDEGAAPGELEFACHTPGHYEAGMNLPIVVEP